MRGTWQFSLAYIFLEIAIFAAAFAIIRLDPYGLTSATPTRGELFLRSLGCFAVGFLLCTGIGGLIKRMTIGAIIGIVVGGLYGLPWLIAAILGYDA
jgi:hypothetical protein